MGSVLDIQGSTPSHAIPLQCGEQLNAQYVALQTCLWHHIPHSRTPLDVALESEAYMKLKAVEESEGQSKKQATMPLLFKRATDSSSAR